MDHKQCFMVHESCLSPNSMPISYFEWKIFQIIWLKAFFLGYSWVSDLIQSSRCTTDWWLILIFSSQKMGFYFDKDLWLIRSDRFEMTNYSWISILLKSNLIFSHLDLSLTEIINSWNKRVVTFVTRDSVLHLAMNLCSGLNFDSLDLWRLLTIRLGKSADLSQILIWTGQASFDWFFGILLTLGQSSSIIIIKW